MGKIKKKYSTKKKKENLRKKAVLFSLLFLISTLLFLSFLLFDSFYQLQEIYISGHQVTPEESLRAFSQRRSVGILNSQSSIFLNQKKIKEDILDLYPHIETVEIIKTFPNEMEIKITEREMEAIWCNFEAICFEIDFSGTVFKRADRDSKEVLIILDSSQGDPEIGQKVIEAEELFIIFDLVESLDYLSIKSVIIPNRGSLFFQSEAGPEIRFSLMDEINSQLERLRILLDKEIDSLEGLEYIELRYGSRVFYKYKN